MNELQAKLARRRSLNGEGEGRTQSNSELSSPNERANSGDQTNKPILTTVKRESSTIATSSKSATDELQKKLARRRNLNGEVSRNLSDIPPSDDNNPFSGDSNPQSRTVSIERSLSTSESLQEPIADEALETNVPNTVDIQSKEIEDDSVDIISLKSIENQVAETPEAPETTSSNTTDESPKPLSNAADIQTDPEEIQDEIVAILSDNDHSNALKMEDSAVSSEDIAFIVESITDTQIKYVEEEQSLILVEEVNNPPPIEPTASISVSTGDSSLSEEVSEVVDVVLPITISTSQPALMENVEQVNFPPTNSPSKLEGHKPISKPASIATSSKSATDELSKKLARRRDLNGEVPKDEAENTQSERSHTSTDTARTVPQQPPSTQPISKSGSKTSLHNNSPIVPVAPPAIPQNSFLNNDDDDNEIDLPFISHKQKETLPKAKKGGKGIWDDDTILSTLEEDDPLNFTLPTNKEEVTKKLFKPKETPKPAEVVNAPAPLPVPETPPSVLIADEGNDDAADLEFDMSLPKLPKKFIESSASKSPKSAERNSKNWYPGKYIKERRLPWSQGKSPNHNNKINSIVDQQQLFNDFVNGLAERKSSVNFDEDLGIGLSFENVEVKSLLEDFEEVDEEKDKPVLLSSSAQKRRVTMMTAPSTTNTNDFLNEFLRENDNLLQEIAATETSTASSTSAVSSKQASSLPPSDETEGLDFSIPTEVVRPRSQMLQRSNSASMRVRKSNLLLENEDDEEAGGLFDDLLSPSEQRNQSSFQPSSTESKGDSLLFEDEKIGKNVNVDDDLSLLLGNDSKALKYNPLEVGSQQSLIRSFANASARRSSVHDREEIAAHPTIDISSKGLLREDDDSSSDGDGEDGEGEKDQGKRSKNLFRESNQSGNNDNSDGINLETKKVKKGKEVPDESITFDEFMLRLKKCSDLMEITNRFILSIKGPNGDGSPPTKFQRIDYRFYGRESIDERCRLFFDEMMNKFSQRPIFAGPECEEWMISMRDCLERYVMFHVGDLAYSTVENKEEDANLLKRMKLLSFLTPEALEIKPDLFNETLLKLAGDELRKINAFKTPFEKVDCIIKCVTIIFRSLSLARVKQEAVENNGGDRENPQLAGADDFLPLFIWVVLTSHIPSLFSNCEYIQAFLSPMRLMSKPGYCLINLRSAIEFVNYIEPTSINIDPDYFQEQLQKKEEELTQLA